MGMDHRETDKNPNMEQGKQKQADTQQKRNESEEPRPRPVIFHTVISIFASCWAQRLSSAEARSQDETPIGPQLGSNAIHRHFNKTNSNLEKSTKILKVLRF
jgi:hypothetical protein